MPQRCTECTKLSCAFCGWENCNRGLTRALTNPDQHNLYETGRISSWYIGFWWKNLLFQRLSKVGVSLTLKKTVWYPPKVIGSISESCSIQIIEEPSDTAHNECCHL